MFAGHAQKETGTHNQNAKGELVLLVLKWVSCESRLQICTIICGHCNYILYVSNCDVAFIWRHILWE